MLETTWPCLEIGFSHCITPQPWCVHSRGKVDEEPNSGEAARKLPDTRPSTAAASMGVESLHPYLGHWPGLTPGLTQVAQPHLWMWTGHKLSVGLETKTISLWHLVTACHLGSVAKGAVKMNMAVPSNKFLHVNCKPCAATKEVNTELQWPWWQGSS